MIRNIVFAVVLVGALVRPSAVAAQAEWVEFEDRAEFFSINFPGQPAVTTTTWATETGKQMPARVYTAQDGRSTYSMTVVKLQGQPLTILKGAIAWEAWRIRRRGGEITYDMYAWTDRIDGHELHIKSTDKKTQTFVSIYLHDGRLYTMEATVPAEMPGAAHFIQSLSILDDTGRRVRYPIDGSGDPTKRIYEYSPAEGR